MNDAGVAPPGTMPMKQPTTHERRLVTQYFGSSFHVCITMLNLSLPSMPLNARPSSIVCRISPMPNRPMTAIRKSKPFSNCVEPNVIRSCPVTVSSPTAASAKPIIIDAITLNGASFDNPTNAANVSR